MPWPAIYFSLAILFAVWAVAAASGPIWIVAKTLSGMFLMFSVLSLWITARHVRLPSG